MTTSGQSITIAYTLKDSTLVMQLASELAANESGNTAVDAGFFMQSLNYTFTDEYLAHLFSTK